MIDGESWRTAKACDRAHSAYVPKPVGRVIAVRPVWARGRLSPAEKTRKPDRGIPDIARVIGGDLDGGRLIGLGCVRLSDIIQC
jgi:hypothetical protein